MKPILLTVAIICVLISTALAQTYSGKVISKKDSLGIEGCHIINISEKEMAISSVAGRFEIKGNVGDTLVVSNINFKTKNLIITGNHSILVRMVPSTVQLEEVLVSRMPATEAAFRKRITNMSMQLDDTFLPFGVKPNKPHSKVPPTYNPARFDNLGYAITKPFSYLSKKLVKSEKEKIEYYQLQANREQTILNEKKYNPQLVQKLTKLEGEELIDFMNFMDMDSHFITKATEYEITELILQKFQSYLDQKG